MAEDSYNGTLWAMGSPYEITCFRVQLDADGHVVGTSVPELNRPTAGRNFDEAVRATLRGRYGEEIAITVVADGGAGFEYFRREMAAGRYPIPPSGEPPQKGQQSLFDEA